MDVRKKNKAMRKTLPRTMRLRLRGVSRLRVQVPECAGEEESREDVGERDGMMGRRRGGSERPARGDEGRTTVEGRFILASSYGRCSLLEEWVRRRVRGVVPHTAGQETDCTGSTKDQAAASRCVSTEHVHVVHVVALSDAFSRDVEERSNPRPCERPYLKLNLLQVKTLLLDVRTSTCEASDAGRLSEPGKHPCRGREPVLRRRSAGRRTGPKAEKSRRWTGYSRSRKVRLGSPGHCAGVTMQHYPAW